MDEKAMIVTPAMRAKVEELVDLVVGALPGYSIEDITLSVKMEQVDLRRSGERRHHRPTARLRLHRASEAR
jgi:hypothetical protein